MPSRPPTSSPTEQRSEDIQELYENVIHVENIIKDSTKAGVAIRKFDAAIESASKSLGDDDPHVVDAKEKRAHILATIFSNNPNRAINEYTQLLAIRNQEHGPTSRKAANIRLALCRVLWSSGNRVEAHGHMLLIIRAHPDALNVDTDIKLATAIGNDLYGYEKKSEAAIIFRAILELLKGSNLELGLRTLEPRRRLAMILFEKAGGDVATKDGMKEVEEAYDLMALNMSILKNHYFNQLLWDRHSEAMAEISNVMVQQGKISASLRPEQIPRRPYSQTHSQGDIGELETRSSPFPFNEPKKEKSDPALSVTRKKPPPLPPRLVLPPRKPRSTLDIGSQFLPGQSPKRKEPGVRIWGRDSPSPLDENSATEPKIEDELKKLTEGGQKSSELPFRSPPMKIPERRSYDISPGPSGIRFPQVAPTPRHVDNEEIVDRQTTTDTQSGDGEGSTLFALEDGGSYILGPHSYPQGPEVSLAWPRQLARGTWLDTKEEGRESNFNDLFGDHRSDFAKRADNWFKSLGTTHELIQHRLSNHVVKLAILDTGLDGEHPFLIQKPFGMGWGEQIKGCISFDDAGTMNTDLSNVEWNAWSQSLRKALRDGTPLNNKQRSGYRDTDGHGTHCTGLLLQTAPNAHIYIAKVGSDRDNDPVAENIAKALKYAACQWDVDIISMSFGFRISNDSHKAIEQTIKSDCKRQILFAAAANHGSNQKYIAYPARLNTVICVKSSDGYGTPSPFSPSKQDDAGRGFFILGQEVLSMWPSRWYDGVRILQRRASGTSVATPIAAGVAALILEFMRQPDKEADRPDKEADWPYLNKSLKKFDVDPTGQMARILTAMSDSTSSTALRKVNYIAPWTLLKSTSDSDEDPPPMTPRKESASKIWNSLD